MPPRCPACPTDGIQSVTKHTALNPTIPPKRLKIRNLYGTNINVICVEGTNSPTMAVNPNKLPEAPTDPDVLPDFPICHCHKRLPTLQHSAEPSQPITNPDGPASATILGPRLRRPMTLNPRCTGAKCMKDEVIMVHHLPAWTLERLTTKFSRRKRNGFMLLCLLACS